MINHCVGDPVVIGIVSSYIIQEVVPGPTAVFDALGLLHQLFDVNQPTLCNIVVLPSYPGPQMEAGCVTESGTSHQSAMAPIAILSVPRLRMGWNVVSPVPEGPLR